MEKREKVRIVQSMQDFILAHLGETEFPFAALYGHVGYSKRHADRLFSDLTGKTPAEYIRALRLSGSAKQLMDSGKSVLEVALDASYESHEGYTRAFSEAFGISPRAYKSGKHFIPLTIPYPVTDYYEHQHPQERRISESFPPCTVSLVQRPRRKLIFRRSKTAQDYWSYCEETDSDWVGLLNSNPAKFDTAAVLDLPSYLQREGYGSVAGGIEVPLSYDGDVPPGFETAELPPCTLLCFASDAGGMDAVPLPFARGGALTTAPTGT